MPVPAAAQTAAPLVRTLSDIEQRVNAALHGKIRRADRAQDLADGVEVTAPARKPQPNIHTLGAGGGADRATVQVVTPKRLMRIAIALTIDDGEVVTAQVADAGDAAPDRACASPLGRLTRLR